MKFTKNLVLSLLVTLFLLFSVILFANYPNLIGGAFVLFYGVAALLVNIVTSFSWPIFLRSFFLAIGVSAAYVLVLCQNHENFYNLLFFCITVFGILGGTFVPRIFVRLQRLKKNESLKEIQEN